MGIIVLDFDNCIALDPRTGEGSEEIKDRAWYKVFPEYGPAALKVILGRAQRAIAGGKGDRKDIAITVLTHFRFKGKISEEARARCERFDVVVQEGIRELGVAPEVKDALEALSKRVPLYINTATPSASMVKTLEAFGLGKFFKNVYGRPGTKVTNLQCIATVEDVSSDNMIFVGDMPGDHEAAKEVGCRFIGVCTKRNVAWHAEQPFPVIGSVAELESLLWGCRK